MIGLQRFIQKSVEVFTGEHAHAKAVHCITFVPRNVCNQLSMQLVSVMVLECLLSRDISLRADQPFDTRSLPIELPTLIRPANDLHTPYIEGRWQYAIGV